VTLTSTRGSYKYITSALFAEYKLRTSRPTDTFLLIVSDFDPKKPTYVLCAAGVRSAQAAQVLVGEGFEEVYNVVGGMYAAAGVNGLVD